MHPTTEPELVIAVDPGTAKAGIAVLGRDGTLIAREIVETAELLEERLRAWAERGPACLVVGDGTGGPALWRNLEEKGMDQLFVRRAVVSERGSSQEGRRLRIEAERRGWRRLVPIGLLTPQGPYDDYAAEVLARRYLAEEGMDA